MILTQYDDWRRRKGCEGKVKFRKGEAYRTARRSWEEGNPSKRVYRCSFCGYWHVGGTRGFDEREQNEWGMQ